MALELLSGNGAVGEAVRLAKPAVISAYPITPQTSIIEAVAEAIAKNRLDTDFITVESEHSAMAAVIGASLTGARTFTATSSQGLALMHELLHWAGGQRTPIVMANVNRALAPPWNIWCDHSDSMAQRDTGWMQVYAETNQEALDLTLSAYRVAEDARVQLPGMVMLDAFTLSHTYMPVEVPDAETVESFLPAYQASDPIEPRTPQIFGSFSPPDLCFMELRHDMALAMQRALDVWAEAECDWGKRVGRPYPGPVEEYRTDDAEVVLLTTGALASTARDAVDHLRSAGLPVGLVRLRLFRPFPREAIRAVAKRFGAIAVIDRSASFGGGAPVVTEVRASVADLVDPPRVGSYIAGLGGRDVRPEHLEKIASDMLKGRGAPVEEWVGVKGVA